MNGEVDETAKLVVDETAGHVKHESTMSEDSSRENNAADANDVGNTEEDATSVQSLPVLQVTPESPTSPTTNSRLPPPPLSPSPSGLSPAERRLRHRSAAEASIFLERMCLF